jgi:nucleotide-binding universal stress UspA family protein
MTYRNILVHVDNSKAAKGRVETAAAIASRFKCFLTGVFLKSEAAPAYLIDDAISMPTENLERYLEERAARISKACTSARSMFAEVVNSAGLPFHWAEVNGDTDADLIACARRHDLIILPPTMKPAFGHNTIQAAQVGMACGGPVLILPLSGYQKEFGKKILVAWNDSRESARALKDAWPFLAQADEIHFLTISRQAQKELDELLERHLREHNCLPAKVVIDMRDDIVTGNIISRHIGMAGADMAVLGLYGHSRLREFVLGGVSRELLDEMPAPLLMSH